MQFEEADAYETVKDIILEWPSCPYSAGGLSFSHNPVRHVVVQTSIWYHMTNGLMCVKLRFHW